MVLICFGTRPEWLKIKPVLDLMDREEYRLLFTGQHSDLLRDVDFDYKASIIEDGPYNRLDEIIKGCLDLPNEPFSAVLVQGDTASAFACALAAYHRGKKIYYLEAGLRSYDLENPYPEEGYRQMISRISTINFAPTELSKQNLIAERVPGEIWVVGNTILDSLAQYANVGYGNTVLVTLHRRENHHWMDSWFIEVNNLAIKYPGLRFVLPIHPNPAVQKHRALLTDVDVVEPLTHDEMMRLLAQCKLVISDSGGIQEEASFFNKKVIVCRKTTERPEGVKTGHLHLCTSPEELQSLFSNLEKDYFINKDCPYGDGRAAYRIKKILDSKSL